MTDPSPSDPTAPGDQIDGRYLVEEVLGRGGMGIVVGARDTVTGEAVAVKLLAGRA